MLIKAFRLIKKELLMDTKKNLVYRVPGKIFHTYIIVSDYVVYHENKSGPYDRNKNMIFLKKKIQ